MPWATAWSTPGFSLGVMPAQELAQTRTGARGALLLHGCLPVAEFGEAWPAGVPVQVHGMDEDPFFTEEEGDLDAAKALVASTSDGPSSSSTPARSTSSLTRHCRLMTKLRRPCSKAGCSPS